MRQSAENQTFLHTRFGLGGDVLEPYKRTIERWVWPDVMRNQEVSVAKAKQAISNYRKAVGEGPGLLELIVFYCEEAAGFCLEYGYDDLPYFNALTRMFVQALVMTNEVPNKEQKTLIKRLDRVRDICHNFGYGVGDSMDDKLTDYLHTEIED